MSWFASSQVDVFPSTYRKDYPSSKLTSENNFVNIINSITDNVGAEGYVLEYDSTNSKLKLVIHGYYFEIDGITINETNNRNLWVGINVEQGGYSLVRYDNDSPEKLDDGTEGNKTFYGLMYNNSDSGFKDSTEDNIYYKLRVSQDGKIVNKIKFSVDSVNYSTGRSLKEELLSKQYIITAGDGIAEITNTQDGVNKVGLQTKEYNKLSGLPGKGMSGKRIYFNENGIATEAPDSENIGNRNITSGGKISSQGVYVSKGIITAGQTIYASTSSPQSGDGENGDIWFKYVE